MNFQAFYFKILLYFSHIIYFFIFQVVFKHLTSYSSHFQVRATFDGVCLPPCWSWTGALSVISAPPSVLRGLVKQAIPSNMVTQSFTYKLPVSGIFIQDFTSILYGSQNIYLGNTCCDKTANG